MQRYAVTATTDGAGAATVYTPSLHGLLQQIEYVKDATNPFDNTVTFAITEEDSGVALLTTGAIAATTLFLPRAATVTVANAAALYAAGGTAVNDKIAVKGRIKFVLAAGGATNDGLFYVWVG